VFSSDHHGRQHFSSSCNGWDQHEVRLPNIVPLPEAEATGSILLHTDLNMNFLIVYIVAMVAHSLQLLFLYHMYQKCLSESGKIAVWRQISASACLYLCNGILLFFGLKGKTEGKLIQSIGVRSSKPFILAPG